MPNRQRCPSLRPTHGFPSTTYQLRNYPPPQPMHCVNGCSGQGRCAEGFCVCKTPFHGVDCSLPLGSKPARLPRIYVYELPPYFNVHLDLRDSMARPLLVVHAMQDFGPPSGLPSYLCGCDSLLTEQTSRRAIPASRCGSGY